MRIQILNKNNNAWYEIDEAPIYTENKNETLDNGTVVISNCSSPIRISPYDIVYIHLDELNVTKIMCVDTYTETLICVNPKIYRYEISLFSETKLLEGIVLPNLKITKVWGITRSIYHYIDQYMSEYCPYIRIQNGNSYTYQPKWNWSALSTVFTQECPEMQWNTPTLREVLNDLMMVQDCIPILKDGVLTYMDLTKVNEKDWSTDNTHINYVSRSKSSEDYVSELQVKLENVTNKTKGVNNVVTMCEYNHLSIPDNEATMTTNNIVLKTKYPIYNLKSVKIMFPGNRKDSTGENVIRRWDMIDLMNLPASNGTDTFSIISEYQEWITKKIRYNAVGPQNFEDWAKYQNFSLYYVRGNNEISNLSQAGRVNWALIINASWVLWELLCDKIMDVNFSYGTTNPPKWYNMLFAIEYETLEGCLFRASKNDDVEHDRVVIDNQTNSMVDSYNQGFMEYQKANRLGNEQLSINARFDLSEDPLIPPIAVGDTYNNCVIYQCQYQFYKNHIEINALATKDYVLREYFTGVKSKIRSWAIASGSEALTRHDLEKYYCEFSYDINSETHGLDELSTNNVAAYLCSPFVDNYPIQPLKTSFIRTVDDNGNAYPPDTIADVKTYYLIDLMSRIIGNSLVFTLGFVDNYWAGQSFHTENDFNDGSTPDSDDKYIKYTDLEVTGQVLGINTKSLVKSTGVPMYQHSYTDNNGEFLQGQVTFGYGVHNAPGNQDVQPNDNWWLNNNTLEQSKSFVYAIYQRPRVSEYSIKYNISPLNYNYEVFSITFNHYKDSQEITNLSTQFEFSTETADICFTKKMLKNQQAVALEHETFNYKVLAYDKNYYNFRRPDKLPDAAVLATENIDFQVTRLTNLTSNIWIIFKGHRLSTQTAARQFAQNIANEHCLYINNGDASTEDVLIALNNVPNTNCNGIQINGLWYPFIIFRLNILRTRNKNIYSADNHYLKVGTIKV